MTKRKHVPLTPRQKLDRANACNDRLHGHNVDLIEINRMSLRAMIVHATSLDAAAEALAKEHPKLSQHCERIAATLRQHEEFRRAEIDRLALHYDVRDNHVAF